MEAGNKLAKTSKVRIRQGFVQSLLGSGRVSGHKSGGKQDIGAALEQGARVWGDGGPGASEWSGRTWGGAGRVCLPVPHTVLRLCPGRSVFIFAKSPLTLIKGQEQVPENSLSDKFVKDQVEVDSPAGRTKDACEIHLQLSPRV